MEVTLKKAVNVFCGDKKEYKTLKYYLLKVLKDSDNENIILREGETVVIELYAVTLYFTWEMISAFNHINFEYVDLLNPENAFEVFD